MIEAIMITIKNMLEYIDKIGLIFNFAGTLMVALSIGRQKRGGGSSTSVDGKVYHTAVINHPDSFKWGLYLISFGFLIQLFAS